MSGGGGRGRAPAPRLGISGGRKWAFRGGGPRLPALRAMRATQSGARGARPSHLAPVLAQFPRKHHVLGAARLLGKYKPRRPPAAPAPCKQGCAHERIAVLGPFGHRRERRAGIAYVVDKQRACRHRRRVDYDAADPRGVGHQAGGDKAAPRGGGDAREFLPAGRLGRPRPEHPRKLLDPAPADQIVRMPGAAGILRLRPRALPRLPLPLLRLLLPLPLRLMQVCRAANGALCKACRRRRRRRVRSNGRRGGVVGGGGMGAMRSRRPRRRARSGAPRVRF